MPELPSGTVTFLFTDIEGSTQRWQQHPTAMPAALARHERLIREAVEAHGGAVFKTVGDAVCAAFPNAVVAVDAALTAQRALYGEPWGQTGPLRVRMALHTGMAAPGGGDYAGGPLNRVARLLAAGHGGQVLLSLPTAELAHDHLPTEVHLRDLGTHQLKDLYRPEHIFQLVTPDLPADFSPLRTADHLPRYAIAGDTAVRERTTTPAPRSRHLAAAPAAAALVLLGLIGAYVARDWGGDGERNTERLAATSVATTSRNVAATDLLAEETMDAPSGSVYVGLAELVYPPGWNGAPQSFPGPLVGYVMQDPSRATPTSFTVLVQGAITVRRAGDGREAASEGRTQAGDYVTLRAGDRVFIPPDTPFAVRTDERTNATLRVVEVFPWLKLTQVPRSGQGLVGEPYTIARSGGRLDEIPGDSVQVALVGMTIPPEGSLRLAEAAGPQLVAVDDGAADVVLFGPGSVVRAELFDVVWPPLLGAESVLAATPGVELRIARGGGIFLPAGTAAAVRNATDQPVVLVHATLVPAPSGPGTPRVAALAAASTSADVDRPIRAPRRRIGQRRLRTARVVPGTPPAPSPAQRPQPRRLGHR